MLRFDSPLKVIDDGDRSLMFSMQCSACAHWYAHEQEHPQTCLAYPEGIPLEIWKAEVKHTTPYPGDHGIQFELEKGLPMPDFLSG